MTTIVDVLARAARQCSVDAPSSWVSATDAEHVELRDDFLLETVEDIAERVDLPAPISASTVITGDDSTDYTLPSNFRRLQRDGRAVFETSNQRRPLIPVTNDGEWTNIQEIGSTGAERYFHVTGYDGNFEINIYDAPSSADSITVHYVTNLWMATSGGTTGSAFTDAGDVLLMPRRIVEAGIVWRFRERNGLPATAKRNEYEMLLNRLSLDSRSRHSVSFGAKATRKPWDVPVPDFIPAS